MGVMKMPLNLLNLEEAAEQLNVSLFTIRAWVYQKRFSTVKLGRRRLIKQEILEKFVQDNIIESR